MEASTKIKIVLSPRPGFFYCSEKDMSEVEKLGYKKSYKLLDQPVWAFESGFQIQPMGGSIFEETPEQESAWEEEYREKVRSITHSLSSNFQVVIHDELKKKLNSKS